MICEPGKDTYKLPGKFFRLYDTAVLNTGENFPDGMMLRLMQLSPAEMFSRKKTDTAWGQPEFFAIVHDQFILHPPPDKAYVVLTRYHTHPKVW